MGPNQVNEGRGVLNLETALEVRGTRGCEKPLTGEVKRQGVRRHHAGFFAAAEVTPGRSAMNHADATLTPCELWPASSVIRSFSLGRL